MGAFSQILPRHRRAHIEAEIELHLERVTALLARLDRADAPFVDLEDDDPAGTLLDKGEAPSDDGKPIYAILPRYGIDQTRGPRNEEEAHRQGLADQLQPPPSPKPLLRSVGL